jgi:PAS domain-containing protein
MKIASVKQTTPSNTHTYVKCIEKFSDVAHLFQMRELTVENLLKLIASHWKKQAFQVKLLKQAQEVTLQQNTDLTQYVESGLHGKRLLKVLIEPTSFLDKDEQQAFNALLHPLIITDNKGMILFANRSAEILFGYSNDELVKKNLGVIIKDDRLCFLGQYEVGRLIHISIFIYLTSIIIISGRLWNWKIKDCYLPKCKIRNIFYSNDYG